MTDEPYAGEHAHLALWVAIAMDSPDTEVIGTVGLRKVGDEATARTDTAESSGLPWIDDWVSRGDVGEIRRLRVALDWSRLGIATA